MASSGRDMLMEECVRMMQQTLRASPSIKKRAKSVYSQRNLGTIKDRKREKKEEKEVNGGETIMRILRMRYVCFRVCYLSVRALKAPFRPNTSDFIAQQLQILATMQAEQEQQQRQQQMRRAQRPGGASRIPEVGTVPEIPPVPQA